MTKRIFISADHGMAIPHGRKRPCYTYKADWKSASPAMAGLCTNSPTVHRRAGLKMR